MQPDTQREGPVQTGPGHHTGPTAGGREAKRGRRGADNRQTNKTQAKGPNHTGEHNTKGETPTSTPAEAPHRQHREPKRAKPERERSNETRTKDGRDNTTKSRPHQGLYGTSSFPYKARCNFAAQLAGNHASRAETPLTRSTPLWRREWGWLVTTTFTGPLGARSRFTSALSLAAPISSERIGRNQYVAYSRHSVSGVATDSARRVSEQMYCASVSASRSVKLRAACVKTSSTVSIASLSRNRHEEAGKLFLHGR